MSLGFFQVSTSFDALCDIPLRVSIKEPEEP